MRRVFFDLDGTLLDSRCRLFTLFSDLLPGHGLSMEEYWNLKRAKVSHETIVVETLGLPLQRWARFRLEWLALIETPKYLALDSPFEGVDQMLRKLRGNGLSLYLATSRQFREETVQQIQRLGWPNLFTAVLVTRQRDDKAFTIRLAVPETSRRDIVVGDTEKDIECGASLGLTTIAVLSGFRNRESLEVHLPDHLFDKVTDIDFSAI